MYNVIWLVCFIGHRQQQRCEPYDLAPAGGRPRGLDAEAERATTGARPIMLHDRDRKKVA
jgi:hypothetical protein